MSVITKFVDVCLHIIKSLLPVMRQSRNLCSGRLRGEYFFVIFDLRGILKQVQDDGEVFGMTVRYLG